jgi:catechol 2,3-dioxygenase-like lactoylglutathione lyase family enzyme
MAITFSHVDLFVEDAGKAVEFYVSLGFEKVRSFEIPQFLRGEFVSKDNKLIGLLQNLTGEVLPAQVSVVNHLVFRIEDLAQDGEELKRNGVEFIGEPLDAGHGLIQFAKGLNGEIMEFFQPHRA